MLAHQTNLSDKVMMSGCVHSWEIYIRKIMKPTLMLFEHALYCIGNPMADHLSGGFHRLNQLLVDSSAVAISFLKHQMQCYHFSDWELTMCLVKNCSEKPTCYALSHHICLAASNVTLFHFQILSRALKKYHLHSSNYSHNWTSLCFYYSHDVLTWTFDWLLQV